ncbi:prepilin-type N-terminal cleavage/methylation domain-containing protein [Bacillus sp. P14.5]|uniref:prepilin-type N-terminal cleavage/methylation domain-containing protein n=1 Tax=Bacillus sp. P14.5 TaxID=1983400 RepID=UPI000DE877A3|nr:prepilin-type N-terminal cleavage/methylation domain-containing protein [Bacillus sp. P14.5]
MLEKMKMIWQDAKQLKDERGLTLVELLVVVVILGIIAAIAVVAIGGIIENSKKDAMVADAKQMVSSAKIYTASNDVIDGTVLNFNGEAEGTTDLSSYVGSLKDPFKEGTYNTATVTVGKNGNKYTYTANLVGEKFTLSGLESALKKDSLSATDSGDDE